MKKILPFLLLVLCFNFIDRKAKGQTPDVYDGSGTITNVFPFGTNTNNKSQYLFKPSDFTVGIVQAGIISTIYFQSGNNTSNAVYSDFTVKMGTTNLSQFPNGTFVTGLSTVVPAQTKTFSNVSSGEWIKIDLDTPFVYDGTSNFIVEVEQSHETNGFGTKHSSVTASRIYGSYGAASGTVQLRHANFGYDMVTAPPDNAGVVAQEAPRSDGLFCSGNKTVKVKIINSGTNPLQSVQLNWKVDNTLQNPQTLTFNPPIDPVTSNNNTKVVTLGTVNFPYQTPVHIKAWTSQPNNNQDPDPADDTLNFTITAQKQSVSVDIQSNKAPSICEGDTIRLDAGNQPPGATYSWNTGATTQAITVHTAGTYSVTVQSQDGCTAVDQIVVTVSPSPHLQDFAIHDIGHGNFTFTPLHVRHVPTLKWDFGDGRSNTVHDTAAQIHHYAQAGTYPVTLTAIGDCQNITITKQIFVELTGIANTTMDKNRLKIYPNPTKDKLYIKVQNQNQQLKQLKVYDVSGAMVYDTKLQGNRAKVSLPALAAGVYQVQIRTNIGLVNRKLEIVK